MSLLQWVSSRRLITMETLCMNGSVSQNFLYWATSWWHTQKMMWGSINSSNGLINVSKYAVTGARRHSISGFDYVCCCFHGDCVNPYRWHLCTTYPSSTTPSSTISGIAPLRRNTTTRQCYTQRITSMGSTSGGHFKNAYELVNLRACKFSSLHTNRIFQCMGKIFCVEFQRYPLKFHTKYLTHTLKDV